MVTQGYEILKDHIFYTLSYFYDNKLKKNIRKFLCLSNVSADIIALYVESGCTLLDSHNKMWACGKPLFCHSTL